MSREEVKKQIDELMRQYDEEEIDKDTYISGMLDLFGIDCDDDE